VEASGGPRATTAVTGVDGKQPAPPRSVADARGAIQDTRPAGGTRAPRGATDVSDEDAHRDDPDTDDQALGGAELLERELGASIIEEIKHD
jgi:DNA polymerase-3 subunit gamma/tau